MAVVAWGVVRLRWFVCSLLIAAGCVPDERPQRVSPSVKAPSPAATPLGASSSESAARAVASGPVLEQPFVDEFERKEPGPDWHLTGPGWQLQDGKLCGRAARNHPAWLRRRMPTNARIEFEATSGSADGDLKVEAWGDGHSAATANSYTNATSYIVIFGGWKNSMHVLARLDEHAPNRVGIHVEPGETDPRAQPVLADRAYRFRIERTDGKTVRYYVDDVEIVALKDPNPLLGEGHEHFAFNDWLVPVCFDHLTITPLKS